MKYGRDSWPTKNLRAQSHLTFPQQGVLCVLQLGSSHGGILKIRGVFAPLPQVCTVAASTLEGWIGLVPEPPIACAKQHMRLLPTQLLILPFSKILLYTHVPLPINLAHVQLLWAVQNRLQGAVRQCPLRH